MLILWPVTILATLLRMQLGIFSTHANFLDFFFLILLGVFQFSRVGYFGIMSYIPNQDPWFLDPNKSYPRANYIYALRLSATADRVLMVVLYMLPS
jgi:hypothetical protein